MRYGHKPEDHALIRGPALDPPTPGARPPQTYDCTCGAHMPGTSRRQAKPAHRQHRAPLTRKGRPGTSGPSTGAH